MMIKKMQTVLRTLILFSSFTSNAEEMESLVSPKTCESMVFEKAEFPLTLKDERSFNLTVAGRFRLRVPLGFKAIAFHGAGAALLYPDKRRVDISVIDEEVDLAAPSVTAPKYRKVFDGELGCDAMREYIMGEVNYKKRFGKDWMTIYAYGNDRYHDFYVIDPDYLHYVVKVSTDGGDVKQFEYILGSFRAIK